MGKQTRPKRQGRPHRIPPAPPAPGDWVGATALEEIAAAGGDLWLLLWHGVRDVWLWSSVDAGKLGELFRPQETTPSHPELVASAALELGRALETFRVLHTTPEALQGEEIAEACGRVADWAEDASLLALSGYYAEAAAIAEPMDPSRAHAAAYRLRRAQVTSRSAQWYERTFKLAVRAGNRDEEVGALIGYGSLLYGLGMYAQARRFLLKGARRAIRTGRRKKAAEAYHDLMLLSLDTNDFRSAAGYASMAESLYPRRHPRIPHLVHDFAVVLNRQHHFALALPQAEKLLPFFHRPEQLALVWGTLGRAAAGVGLTERFHVAESHVLRLVEQHNEHGAAALVSTAEGARSLRRWEQARKYAQLAIRIAKIRKDAGQERRAREILRYVSKQEPAPGVAPAPEDLTALARRIAARLRAWKPPK